MKHRWLVLVAFTSIIAAALGCEPTPTPTPYREPQPQPAQNEPPPANEGQPDLRVLEMSIERYDQGGLSHRLVAVVENSGSVEASGFDAGCTYECPSGTITRAGVDIVIDGYIAAYDRFTYTQPFMMQCDPPPGSVYMECTIDTSNVIAESYEDNNYTAYTVPVP